MLKKEDTRWHHFYYTLFQAACYVEFFFLTIPRVDKILNCINCALRTFLFRIDYRVLHKFSISNGFSYF